MLPSLRQHRLGPSDHVCKEPLICSTCSSLSSTFPTTGSIGFNMDPHHCFNAFWMSANLNRTMAELMPQKSGFYSLLIPLGGGGAGGDGQLFRFARARFISDAILTIPR
eukprot:4642513-Amphidinium_carterae.1